VEFHVSGDHGLNSKYFNFFTQYVILPLMKIIGLWMLLWYKQPTWYYTVWFRLHLRVSQNLAANWWVCLINLFNSSTQSDRPMGRYTHMYLIVGELFNMYLVF